MSNVVELWRYPVKSMQGERLAVLEVAETGVVGDRRYGVVGADGKVLSAKTVPELLFASARTEAGEVVITLPDGTETNADDATGPIASWLGREVAVIDVATIGSTSYEMTFDPPDDTAEQFEIPTPPGTFLDLAGIHLLTTGALAACRTARPDLLWDVRRFRPNVLVEHDVGGIPEDAWVDRDMQLGSVVIHVDMQTVRCAMPLRAQRGIDRSVDVYRTLDALSIEGHHPNHLGVYATVVADGTVAEGDSTQLLS